MLGRPDDIPTSHLGVHGDGPRIITSVRLALALVAMATVVDMAAMVALVAMAAMAASTAMAGRWRSSLILINL